MPTRQVRFYVRMLPQLDAERTLTRVNAAAVASGAMEERDSKQYVRDLQRRASGGAIPAAVKPTPAALTQMGIAIEDV